MPSTNYFGTLNPQIATNTYNIANFSTNAGRTKFIKANEYTGIMVNGADTFGGAFISNNLSWIHGYGYGTYDFTQQYNLNLFNTSTNGGYDYSKIAGIYMNIVVTNTENLGDGGYAVIRYILKNSTYIDYEALSVSRYINNTYIPLNNGDNYFSIRPFTYSTAQPSSSYDILGFLQYV